MLGLGLRRESQGTRPFRWKWRFSALSAAPQIATWRPAVPALSMQKCVDRASETAHYGQQGVREYSQEGSMSLAAELVSRTLLWPWASIT